MMNSSIEIRQMQHDDIELVFQALTDHNMPKPLDYIKKCWEENTTDERITLIATHGDQFAGWLHLLRKSSYPYFVENGIPEISNFDVVTSLRHLGIGTKLMDEIEGIAFNQYDTIGIGVGLYPSYGDAQRMYAKRGYIPDGRGIMYQGEQSQPGNFVFLDDDLNLFFTKEKKNL